MATTKVCGIETEYGIHSPGAEQNPISRVVGPGQRLRLRHRAEDRLGLRGRDPGQRRPRLRPRGLPGPHGRDPPGQHGPHQRRPLLRRPRPPRVLHPRVPDPPRVPRPRQGGRGGAAAGHAGGGAAHPGPAGPDRLQEQLRRQGQLLRLPRELHDGPGRALRQGDRGRGARTSSRAPSSPGRARWAWRRPHSMPTPSTSRSPSGPSSSRRSSAWRRPSSARSSTPATSPTPTPAGSGACTSSSATPTSPRSPPC